MKEGKTMDVALYTSKPGKIKYMALPDKAGTADVWLRKNIKQITVTPMEPGPGGEPAAEEQYWQADEVYFRAELTEAEVKERFEELFRDPPVPPEPLPEPTELERIEGLEAGLLELAEVIYGG